jgi:hypothetical protein
MVTFDFTKVEAFDAFQDTQFTAKLILTPKFFDWFCQDPDTDGWGETPAGTSQNRCGGMTAAQYITHATTGTDTETARSCANLEDEAGNTHPKADLKGYEVQAGCMFHHVNVHTCPVRASDELTIGSGDCTPYIGKTMANGAALATHTSTQSHRGYLNPNTGNVELDVTFTTKVTTITDNVQDYTTIAHFRLGVKNRADSVSFAAGYSHKINSQSQYTNCMVGYVPNPDKTCAVCDAGYRANPPTLADGQSWVMDYTTDADAAAAQVLAIDTAGGQLSEFSKSQYCVQCPAGSINPAGSKASERAGISCKLCEKGTYQGSTGGQSCTPCLAGTFAPEKGASQCSPCTEGHYQSENGQSQCILASSGYFVSSVKATAQTACPDASMISERGSKSGAECKCKEGWYMKLANVKDEIGEKCLPCPEGFTCAGGKVAYTEGGVAKERHQLPVLKQEFMALESEPYNAFDCRQKERCPGGSEPAWSYKGVCTPDAEGINCFECKDGFYLTDYGAKCSECNAAHTVMFLVMMMLGAFGLFAVYKIANSPLTIEMSPLLSLSISLGVTLGMVQALGMISSLAISWPSPIREIMGFMKFFLFDLESFGIECISSAHPVIKVLTKQILPPIIIATYFIAAKAGWCDKDKCVNSAGMLLCGFFAAFSLAAFAPFACYENPNGKWTMQSQPNVICDAEEDSVYGGLWFIGFLTFLLYPLGGLAFLCYTIKSGPKKSLDRLYLVRYRFLFFRFRPDRYYWMPCLLLRNTLIGFPQVLFDEPQAQALGVLIVLQVSLAATMYYWPWRSTLLNAFDCFSVFIVILILSFWFPLAPQVKGSTDAYTSFTVFCLFSLMLGVLYTFTRVFVDMYSKYAGKQTGNQAKYKKTIALLTAVSDHFRDIGDDKDAMHADCRSILKEFSTFEMSEAMRVYTTMLLYVASPADREEIMSGDGWFSADRVLFRPPSAIRRSLSRKSLTNLQEGMEAAGFKPKKGNSTDKINSAEQNV